MFEEWEFISSIIPPHLYWTKHYCLMWILLEANCTHNFMEEPRDIQINLARERGRGGRHVCTWCFHRISPEATYLHSSCKVEIRDRAWFESILSFWTCVTSSIFNLKIKSLNSSENVTFIGNVFIKKKITEYYITRDKKRSLQKYYATGIFGSFARKDFWTILF